MTSYKWQFAPRFCQNAFGWKSDKPIQRIKEALTEIKQVAKKEPVMAAEGAVLFLEKIAPAVSRVEETLKIRAHLWRRITLSSTQQKRAVIGPLLI
jgi:hypothetical protein